MRQIKFRAWAETTGGDHLMVYGLHMWSMGEIENSKDHIMQFTGLLDKNGKEIYEGDIVMPKNQQTEENKHYMGIPDPYEIKIPDLFYALAESDYWFKDCEIIGNIYQNPELIKSNE